MKKLFIFSIITILFITCNTNEKRIPRGKSDFQRKLNSKFKDASKSPLTKKDLQNFKGLDFFPINEKYKVVAKLTKTPDAPEFKFPTTTERVVSYKKYGIVAFTIDNQNFELAIYKDENTIPEYENYLFLPFLDKTNGKTSYAGGRFVEVFTSDENEDGTITIDFNKAYNPYCAYNSTYSCPITPRSNFLNIEINAGVMAYKK